MPKPPAKTVHRTLRAQPLAFLGPREDLAAPQPSVAQPKAQGPKDTRLDKLTIPALPKGWFIDPPLKMYFPFNHHPWGGTGP